MTIEELRRLPEKESDDWFQAFNNGQCLYFQENETGEVKPVDQQLENKDLNSSFGLTYFIMNPNNSSESLSDGSEENFSTEIKLQFEKFEDGILSNLDKCDSTYWFLRAILDLPDVEKQGHSESGKFQFRTVYQIGQIEGNSNSSRKGYIVYYDHPDIKQVEVDLNDLAQEQIDELKGVASKKNRDFIERYSI